MTQKQKLLEQYSDYLKMRNYSVQTYKAYMGSVRKFWEYCEQQCGNSRFEKENAVQSYLAHRMSVQKLSFSTVNGDYAALQWFYKYILNRPWDLKKLIRPKREKRLPRYISPEQVEQLVEACQFQKHKIMVLTYYSTGMRLSEARMLKWEDVSFEEGIIHVRKGKGAKDRITILHKEMAELLKDYRQSIPAAQVVVFAGKHYKSPISARAVQWAFIQARRRAKLPDWVTAHVLRHSYATTVLRNATDLLSLKELLGHKKLSTTTRYLHLNIDHYKKSHNPLSHQCLNVVIQESQQNTPSERSSDDLVNAI